MSPEPRSEKAGEAQEPQSGVLSEAERKLARQRRRRRRLRRLAALGVLVLIIVCGLPYLLSTGVGTKAILSAANSYLPGKVQLQDLSLSWFGPCKATGLQLIDPESREVVRVNDVIWAGGIWRGVTSPFQFDQLDLKTPQVTLFMNEEGETSLVHALVKDRKTTPPEQPSTLPAFTGTLVLSNGLMKIVRPDGRQLLISHIDGKLNMENTSNVTGKLAAEVAEAGPVAGEIDVKQLVRDGRFQPWEATGTASLSTPAKLSLAELGEFAVGQSQASGSAHVQMKAAFGQGEATVDSSITLDRLLVKLADSVKTEPIDVRLSSQLRATRDSLTAHAALEGQIGDGQLDLSYPWPKETTSLSMDDIVSGVLAGKAVKWPDLVVEAKSRVDLARLAQAVPALLHIQSNVVVTGGTLNVERLVLRGGDKPSTTGAVTLAKLTSQRGGQTNTWEPISLNWDAGIEPGSGLRLEKAAFSSGFARLAAKGSPSDLHADFQADLAKLNQQASQLVDMGGAELGGGASGTLDLKRAGQERIDLALTMVADSFRYRSGERQVQIGKLSAKKNGYFALAGAKVTRLTITDAAWDTDGRLAGTGSGWVSIGDGGFDVGMDVKRADLAYVAQHLTGLGITGTVGYTGEATLQAKGRRSSQDSPVTSDGTVVVRNTALHGKPLLAENTSLTWSGLSIAPTGKQFEIKSAELSGPPARMSATGVTVRAGGGGELVVEGKIEGNANLADCLTISSRIAGRDKPPAMTGRLTLSAVSQGVADGSRLTGDARIDGLTIGTGDKTIRENQVRLAVQAGVNTRQHAVSVDQFQMDSQLLAMKVTGKISDYAGACPLDLTGNYRGSWDAIMALVHELAPATANTVTIAGVSESPFTVTGTAYQPQVTTPGFTGVSAATKVGWTSAMVCGVQMDKALLAPTFKEGQLIVPVSTVPAAGGQVHLGGNVDFRPTTPLLSLEPKLQVLENIRITPELGRDLLSRVNPIFGSMTRAEGTVSLMTEGIQLPLGEEIKTGGSGQGRLDLKNLRIQPTGFLMALLELGGLTGGDNYAVQVSGVDFRLKDGRLFYENFTLTFGQDFDLRFRGSVGFDDTLNLAVSVPVRPALLDRLGVGGPTKEYASLLSKIRIEIPVMGTRSNPKFDLSQVDLKPLIEEATRSAVSQGTDGLLKGLLGVKQSPKIDSAGETAGRPTLPGFKAPERPAADPGKAVQQKALDLLGGRKSSTSRPAQGGLESLKPLIRERTGPTTKPAASQPIRNFLRRERR